MALPLISLVIATYNNGSYLQGCLQSLSGQDLSSSQFEVVVVDNGSCDDTAARVETLAASLPLRYHYFPKRASFETALARNAGFRLARGEVILSLADDALLPANLLRAHVDFHQANPKACLVGARRFVQRLLPPAAALAHLQASELEWEAGPRDPQRHLPQVHPSSSVQRWAPWALGNWDHLSVRREALAAADGFDEGYSLYEEPDYELSYRLFQTGLEFVFEPALAIYHQCRYRFPRAHWRGRGFDYLTSKFSDKSVAALRVLWRFQEEIEFRGDLCLSEVHHRRVGSLLAAANHAPPVASPSSTIGILDSDGKTEALELPQVEGVETRTVANLPPTLRRQEAVEELRGTIAQAREGRTRDLLQVYAAAHVKERRQRAQARRMWQQAQGDLFVVADGNGLREWCLPSRPGLVPLGENSLVLRGLARQLEEREGLSTGGPLSEGFSYPPRAISFKLTNLCNLRCRMCGQYGRVGNSLRQPPQKLREQMDWEDLRRILDQVAPLRPGMIYIWGGEPFLHPAFIDLVNYIKQQNLFCIVTTNGTRLEEQARALVASRLDIVRVSVDGPPETHDMIRGAPGLFRRVVRGIQAVQEQKRATGSLFPLFEIVCTISQDNYRELEEVASFFEKMEVNTITFVHQLYTPPEIGRRHQEFYQQVFGCPARAWEGFAQDVSGIDSVALGQTIERLEHRGGPVPIGFSPPLRGAEQVAAYYTRLDTLFHDKRCSGPWLWLEVYPNGDIYPCHEFPDFRVGNILEEGLAVWNGPRFRDFRRQLMSHRGFPGCVACRSQQLVDAFVV